MRNYITPVVVVLIEISRGKPVSNPRRLTNHVDDGNLKCTCLRSYAYNVVVTKGCFVQRVWTEGVNLVKLDRVGKVMIGFRHVGPEGSAARVERSTVVVAVNSIFAEDLIASNIVLQSVPVVRQVKDSRVDHGQVAGNVSRSGSVASSWKDICSSLRDRGRGPMRRGILSQELRSESVGEIHLCKVDELRVF